MKIKTLLYAHMLREPVPASLQADMLYVLQHSHRLLNGLLNIIMEQRFVTTSMNVIEFSQLLTQGLWFHSNALLQLPHFDQQQIKQLNKVLTTSSKSAGSTMDKVRAPPPRRAAGPSRRRGAKASVRLPRSPLAPRPQKNGARARAQEWGTGTRPSQPSPPSPPSPPSSPPTPRPP